MATKKSQSARRKPRSDAQQNRARILEAAKKAFSRSGALTSMDAVARRAGGGARAHYTGTFPRARRCWRPCIARSWKSWPLRSMSLPPHCRPLDALRAWMLLFVEYIAAKQIILPALNMVPGGPAKIFQKQRLADYRRDRVAWCRGRFRAARFERISRRWICSAHCMGFQALPPCRIGPQSARRLVDILIQGSRSMK